MGNVVIVTHWLDGDVIPFVRIGKELKTRGHNVVLITHCYFEEMARKAGIDFEAWDSPEEYAALVEAMGENRVDDTKQNNYSFSASAFRQKYESNEMRMREYEKIMKYCLNSNTVILCKNRSSIAAYMVAEKMKLPLATVMMNPTEVASMLLYEQLEGINDLGRLNALRRLVGLSDIHSWLQWESSAKMSLALWPEWYDSEESEWPTHIEKVGFPLEMGKEVGNQEIPKRFLEWSDGKTGIIVITGGTTKCIAEQFYSTSIAACEMSGQPTVVLTRYRELLPDQLPSNVIWFDYLPLDKILSKISLLIHHGGMGTLAGALSAGVPQLILPCYVDRPYNAALIKKLGVGDYLFLANWSAEKINAKIKSVQELSVIEKTKIFSEKMKKNHGVTVAADYVEKMIRDEKYIYTINNSFRYMNFPQNGTKDNEKSIVLTEEQRKRILLNRLKVRKTDNRM